MTEAQGLIKQKIAIAAATLEQYRSLVNSKLAAYKQWIDLPKKGGQPVPEIQHLINYVEGIPGVQIGGEMKDLADAMRDIYQNTRLHVENTIPNLNPFIKDYYRHMWTDPVKAAQAFGSRTGSSASLKLRTIPTLAQGILVHGLTPRILDPIENTLAYVHSMQSYLANYTVRDIGESIGQLIYSRSGPPAGTNWVKLTGAATNTPKMGQAYATPGWARVYNSWAGRGVYDWSNPMWGKIYDKMLVASNTMTALKLGLSGYHAWNIAQETITSGLSKAFGNFEHGELGRGLAELGLTATVAPKIVKNLYRGRELRLAYLQNAGAHPNDVALMNLYARSGGACGEGSGLSGCRDTQLRESVPGGLPKVPDEGTVGKAGRCSWRDQAGNRAPAPWPRHRVLRQPDRQHLLHCHGTPVRPGHSGSKECSLG